MFTLALAAVLAFQVSWTDNSDNEEGFRIYRSAELIATVGPDVQTYIDSTVEYGLEYCYQVAAFNHNIVGVDQEATSNQACLLVDQPHQFMLPATPTIGTVAQQ